MLTPHCLHICIGAWSGMCGCQRYEISPINKIMLHNFLVWKLVMKMENFGNYYITPETYCSMFIINIFI